MSDQPTGEVPKRRLAQRYELGQMIGRGGMAEVFEGQDLRLNRKVAVKILRPDLVQDSTFHQRFRREAHSAASLNHPNIVAVYDTGEDILDGPLPVPFIVMEFVDGMTLKQLMSSGRRLLPERALELTSGVLAALDYSHRHGIVHRDIKPANVMLTPGGEIKVMDFGIARALAAEGQTVTSTSAVMGTAQYLSPEQARGEVVDARSDLYSTGCMLFELLTSRPPFIGESPVSIAYQHVSEMATPPSQLDPAVPESVDAVVMRALAKDVNDRYQSAAEFRQDVERAIAGAPVTAMLAPAGAAAATQIMSPSGTAATAAVAAPAKQEKKQTSPWVWVGVAAAILVVGGLAIALGSSLFGGTETVSVPSLRGMTVEEANSELAQAGLRLGQQTPEASDEPSGTIIEQDPSPGEQIQQGQAVNVTVSAGPDEVVVPQLVGLDSADAARRALQDVGLELGTTTPRDSDQPEGFVLESDPVAGHTLAKGERVDIWVSSGFVTVPNVEGQTEDSARRDISDAGLEVEVVYQAGTSGVGTVVAQSPDGGARAKAGDTVTINVVEEPEPTPTPTPTPTETTPAPDGDGEPLTGDPGQDGQPLGDPGDGETAQ